MIYSDCFNIIDQQLKKNDPECNISDISILAYLKENWMNIANPDAFEKIFHELFYPFINLIFDNDIPESTFSVLRKFEALCWKYHLKTQSSMVTNYLMSNNLDYLLDKALTKSLPHVLCDEYLKMGIDCVLIGMRKTNYVNNFEDFFTKKHLL